MSPCHQVKEINGNSTVDTSEIARNSKLEILYDGYFYDVTNWIPRHPGGSVIKFYTEPGENATIAVQQFHYRVFPQVEKILKSFKKRPATETELRTYMPAKEINRHEALTKDFQELHNQLEDEGFFKPSIPHVVLRITELAFWFILAIWMSITGKKWLGVLVGGIAGSRAGMLNHEAGHYSLTGNSKLDRFLDSFLFGFGSGISAAWWRSQHNRHHAMPQRLNHDVDLETMPFIAFNSQVVRKPEDGRSFFIQNQKFLFATLDTALVVPYWKLWLNPRYVFKKREYTDICFLVLHYAFFFWIMEISLLQYWTMVWIATTYLFTIFAMNHSHLEVTSDKLHWVEYCLLHTVDITPHWVVDFYMNFLNYQIEHHLFPAMPQFRQRLVKDRVQRLALKHGLPYRTMGFFEAFKTVFRNLGEVSDTLKNIESTKSRNE